jgi:chromosome segregation protein
MIEVERRVQETIPKHISESHAVVFAPTEYHQLLSDLQFFISETKTATTLEAVRHAIARIEPLLVRLAEREPRDVPQDETQENTQLVEAVQEMEKLAQELNAILAEEESVQSKLTEAEQAREMQLAAVHASTQERIELQSALAQCQAKAQIAKASHQLLQERKVRFDEELREAGFLFGPAFVRQLVDASLPPAFDAHAVRRTIDRLKVRLEEHSGIGNEVVAEYETTMERDTFLARELADTESSIRNLETLIMDLKKILDEKFTDGVKIINERFSEFFIAMFGGGSAFLSITVEKKRKSKLSVEDESEDPELAEGRDDRFFERGIEVHVNLPSKKVKELNMLSGGERSLVSIALLFAISQVNPPPFLVLDETDAALDESNSRKYGDMIERLAAYSQLIVVTHNRETMSRASVLYGVTLGSDGGSKLLSIKFDEAVKVAK